MGQTGDLIPGTLEVLVLKTLTEAPLHGYDIANAIHARSAEVLKVEEGALYPALHRLELRGWVKSEWSTSDNNRRAKYYRLTAAGRRAMDAETSRWKRMFAATTRVQAT
jgi:transcriptional regulator